jgi:hypothetical protein
MCILAIEIQRNAARLAVRGFGQDYLRNAVVSSKLLLVVLVTGGFTIGTASAIVRLQWTQKRKRQGPRGRVPPPLREAQQSPTKTASVRFRGPSWLVLSPKSCAPEWRIASKSEWNRLHLGQETNIKHLPRRRQLRLPRRNDQDSGRRRPSGNGAGEKADATDNTNANASDTSNTKVASVAPAFLRGPSSFKTKDDKELKSLKMSFPLRKRKVKCCVRRRGELRTSLKRRKRRSVR